MPPRFRKEFLDEDPGSKNLSRLTKVQGLGRGMVSTASCAEGQLPGDVRDDFGKDIVGRAALCGNSDVLEAAVRISEAFR
jgi:hypothetical protein